MGIEDPMTEKPGVRLAMECAYQNGRNILWQRKNRVAFGPFAFGRTGNKKLEEVEKCQKK